MIFLLQRQYRYGNIRVVRNRPLHSFSTRTKELSSKDDCYVAVTRNVRYSDNHERNVMDIYQPFNLKENNQNGDKKNIPSFLFVHGGMWLRGSKDQQTLSYSEYSYEMAKDFYQSWTSGSQKSQSSSSEEQAYDEKNTKVQSPAQIYSDIGLTMASHHYGGNVYILNYRLVGRNKDETVYPQQVYDVARAIIHVLLKEMETKSSPKLWIGGHSAGAHLASLVLSDNRFLQQSFEEYQKKHDNAPSSILPWRELISGFVGISGPYNLQRLAMSPMADITIGPTFLGKIYDSSVDDSNNYTTKQQNVYDSDKVDETQIIKEASPLHVILDKINTGNSAKHCNNDDSNIPPIARDKNLNSELPLLSQIPVMLMNAESDFHLHKDSKELLVALQQFSSNKEDEENSKGKNIQHEVMKGTNHLTIMKYFGSELFPNRIWEQHECTSGDLKEHGVFSESDDSKIIFHSTKKEESNDFDSFTSGVTSLFGQVSNIINTNILASSTGNPNDEMINAVASNIIKFIKTK